MCVIFAYLPSIKEKEAEYFINLSSRVYNNLRYVYLLSFPNNFPITINTPSITAKIMPTITGLDFILLFIIIILSDILSSIIGAVIGADGSEISVSHLV